MSGTWKQPIFTADRVKAVVRMPPNEVRRPRPDQETRPATNSQTTTGYEANSKPVAGRPYAETAPRYQESGWHPLPVPWGKKGPPPLGMTGHDGHPPTIDTVRMWCTKPAFEDKARGNICLVMSDEVIGIDVDHYGDKTGGDTLAGLEARLGVLPATAASTARDDKISGIRFFRVPAGRRWKESAGQHIEIIQRVHRYAMAWPSIHPEGWIYGWYWSATGS